MAEVQVRRLQVEDIVSRLAREEQIELIDGQAVARAQPSYAHGAIQARFGAVLAPFARKPNGTRGPGGWWIGTEVDVLYPENGDVYRHDVLGHRRDRHPDRPSGLPIAARPDWVCEILSPSNARNDTVKKQRTLHRHGVPHYWLVDPERQMLTVLRHGADGYVIVLTAGPGEVVRAEPFEAVEIEVDELLGET